MSTILDINTKDLTEIQLDEKIQELSGKYYIAARMGNHYLQDQILLVIDTFRSEQQRRLYARMKDNEDDLGNLIKVNK